MIDPTQVKSVEIGGLGPYSATEFEGLGLGEYRDRFPVETASLSDVHIWNIVSHTEDDMSDDEWRAAFRAAADQLPDQQG